ncbi:hypothetical protein E4T44_01158 [Aureobasidium sp. EXF-8845]|nr:hypothetical protein E4T44_01158 [Aureobasidium sp. EXF-8845]KAI4857160.1 hypothetical protein E4T45_01361 [Aureobasidium sp. EXF-8846]
MDCLPIPFVCFQCGTDQNPCHCKVVGPTIGFASAIVLAVRNLICTKKSSILIKK